MDGGTITHEDMQSATPAGLTLLRKPFGKDEISKLPKPTKRQTEEAKAPKWNGIKCQVCGTWHHKDVVHLDYVGHAALTHRLLDCDPLWNWEPVAFDDKGMPMRDASGGMWIKLTVCGVSRYGYGDAAGKSGGDAIKEIIGDALRNAAMRFGAALNLWHKGELPPVDGPDETPPAETPPKVEDKPPAKDTREIVKALKDKIDAITDAAACNVPAIAKAYEADWQAINDKQRDWLSERIANRAGTLMQAPADDNPFPETTDA